jgi:hypothetical protein
VFPLLSVAVKVVDAVSIGCAGALADWRFCCGAGVLELPPPHPDIKEAETTDR